MLLGFRKIFPNYISTISTIGVVIYLCTTKPKGAIGKTKSSFKAIAVFMVKKGYK